jgi:arylsulfatase A-like enzyme
VSGMPENEITIAELAKENGYFTGFIGQLIKFIFKNS